MNSVYYKKKYLLWFCCQNGQFAILLKINFIKIIKYPTPDNLFGNIEDRITSRTCWHHYGWQWSLGKTKKIPQNLWA